jgi:nucleotide-binding universal stress UspA family protein
MKKIIVPIDFSQHSEYALEAAALLAKNHDAEILALHMLEMSDNLLINTDNEQHAKAVFFLKLAEQKFEEFLDKDYLKGIKVTPIVKHFKVFNEVSEVAKEHRADLIVMGSHGSSGVKEIFIGSNTEKVVRHSNIPVLILKSDPILMDFENVVFACDFSEDSIKPYLNASKLFKTLNSKMHLLYVNLPSESFKSSSEMEKGVVDFLKKADGNLDKIKSVHYVSDYSVEKGIINFANLLGADLIAVATHGRTGIAHFFEGSVSENVANHSLLPVMTFKI